MKYTLKKSLGQHFLYDEQMCQKIIAQIDRQPGMNLLEIGPGGGALTKYLLDWKDVNYQAVEVDAEKVAHKNKVTLGVRRAGEVEVSEGLQAGNVIIVDGSMTVQDGMTVTLQGP